MYLPNKGVSNDEWHVEHGYVLYLSQNNRTAGLSSWVLQRMSNDPYNAIEKRSCIYSIVLDAYNISFLKMGIKAALSHLDLLEER